MGSEKLCTPYPVTQYHRNYVPHTLETMYPRSHRNYVPCALGTMHFYQKINIKGDYTTKVKPLTFQHKNMFIVFTFNIHVETIGPCCWVSSQVIKFFILSLSCDGNPGWKMFNLKFQLVSYELLCNTLKVSWAIADQKDNRGFSPGTVHYRNHSRHTLD